MHIRLGQRPSHIHERTTQSSGGSHRVLHLLHHRHFFLHPSRMNPATKTTLERKGSRRPPFRIVPASSLPLRPLNDPLPLSMASPPPRRPPSSVGFLLLLFLLFLVFPSVIVMVIVVVVTVATADAHTTDAQIEPFVIEASIAIISEFAMGLIATEVVSATTMRSVRHRDGGHPDVSFAPRSPPQDRHSRRHRTVPRPGGYASRAMRGAPRRRQRRRWRRGSHIHATEADETIVPIAPAVVSVVVAVVVDVVMVVASNSGPHVVTTTVRPRRRDSRHCDISMIPASGGIDRLPGRRHRSLTPTTRRSCHRR